MIAETCKHKPFNPSIKLNAFINAVKNNDVIKINKY